MKLSDIKPNPKNPRTIRDENFKKLVQSIKDFPEMLDARPLVLNKDNVILGGNMRYKAAKEAGLTELPVKIVDWSKEKQDEFIIKDNVSGGDWDWDTLANEWDTALLDEWGLELPDSIKEEAEVEEDEAPEVSSEPAVSKLGEVYQLGRHRVMCGSCQEEDNLTKLFGSENPRMVVTSPPYADARTYNIGKFDWDELMNDLANTFHEFNNCDMIFNLGQLHRDGKVWFYWNDWLEHMEKCGYPLFGMYVWDKLNAVPGEYNGRLSQAHEWIFHFRTNNTGSAKKTEKTKGFAKTGTFRQTDGTLKSATSPDKINQGVKIKESVIRTAPEKNNQSGHPAVYSVVFANELMESWSSGGDLIYDPFLGSGTTLIACEQTDRTCYGCELDEKYVDVIRKRYAKFIDPNGWEESWQTMTPAIN